MKPGCLSMSLLAAVTTMAAAGEVAIQQLGTLTPQYSRVAYGEIAATQFADTEQGTIDGDDVLDTTADITIAWEMSLKALSPNDARDFIFSLGNGDSSGLSLFWKDSDDTFYLQAESGATQLGGDGSGGTAALSYKPTTGDDLNISRTWVVSLDTDATASTLSLFIDGKLIGSVTGGPITDWSPEITGAFRQGPSGVTPLREDFGSAGAAGTVGSSQIDTSALRCYENIVATPVPEGHPYVTSFTVDPARITAGESCTLNWTVKEATTVTITPGVGDVTSQTINGSGSVEVTPPGPVRYTLTVTNAEGSSAANLDVPVDITFSVDQTRIDAGQPCTLSWQVGNATSVSIEPGIGDVTPQTSGGSGSLTVTPTQTTHYTLTATYGSGSSKAESGVRVIGKTADRRPNIILFYVDDMGWQDTSVPFWDKETIFNRRYITPSMETLASNGVVLTNAHACAALCGPSRYALMSGLLPARSHYTFNGSQNSPTVNAPVWDPLPIQDRPTLARSLNALGYHTVQVGKWHLGNAASIYSAGYDVKIGGHDKGQPGSYYGNVKFGSGEYQVPDLGEYHGQNIFLTEALTLEANKQIEAAVRNAEPFFLYMSHYAIHAPIQADSRFTAHYNDSSDSDHYISNSTERAYATLIEGMDKSLGDLMTKVTELGVDRETIIVFSTDNGGVSKSPRGPSPYGGSTHNWPLRLGKVWTYEGGHRVPTLVSWVTPDNANPVQQAHPVAGNRKDARFISQLDFFPTLVSMAGGTPPEGLDGDDISPWFANTPELSRPASFLWHQPNWRPDAGVPHQTGFTYGDFKIIHFIENNTWELYDLSTDISETTNLAATHPEKLAILARKMTRKLQEVGAQHPTWKATGEEIKTIPPGPPPAQDVDYDGVPDADEDNNGDGIISPGESDPNRFDRFERLNFRIERETGALRVKYRRVSGPTPDIWFKLLKSENALLWNDYVDSEPVTDYDHGDGTSTIGHAVHPSGEDSPTTQLFRLQIGGPAVDGYTP
ncbi:MAG: sulfatase-like hydrolase/transferase [Akkermansiaceae bacterium]|nr:sulfatase-like hydrolase/transferase [Akkermansiaceae bacterium]